MARLFRIEPGAPAEFPDPELALREPDGLLAAGGDLGPERLLAAYREGIFPWFSDGQPILWWSPDPRAVLFPGQIRIARSLRKTLKSHRYRASMDTDFAAVIAACAEPRPGQEGTWITAAMRDAYLRLHQLGVAHSVEVWEDGSLVGGLYGVAIGRVFFGESMFTRARDASKVALVHLAGQLRDWGFPLIDCQQTTGHLLSMGAVEIPRREFLHRVREARELPGPSGTWRLDWAYDPGARPASGRR
ncbi:MAG: leucyl/phenylalanyl-tRNA--protein transferase [Gammaproteobacteria bacterium]|nr:leucyl/phenylalanyl-tRNA--protein transferase [Gammaproteobacteria bacterium]